MFPLPLAEISPGELKIQMIMSIVLLSLVAIGWFGVATQKQAHGTKRFWKWIALAFPVIGLIYGIQRVAALNSTLYREYMNFGEGMTALSWATAVVPLVLIIGLGVWGLLHDRREIVDI